MAECATTEELTPEGEPTLPQSSTLVDNCSQEDVGSIDVKIDGQGKSYIKVSCGDVVGVLYLEKLRKTAGAKGMEKCILCDGNMLTPSEFDQTAGKKANKVWKKVNQA